MRLCIYLVVPVHGKLSYRSDLFVALPTGYGKLNCCAVMPSVYHLCCVWLY